MQAHEVKTRKPRAVKKVVGRGGKRGKTSGRGTKGQDARAGHRKRPQMRDTIKKLPKLRGEGVSRNQFKTEFTHYVVLNLGILNLEFKAGDRVTPKVLLEHSLVEKKGNKVPIIKILGSGVLDKKLDIRGCLISESAKTAVEKLGGTVK
ncbi:MAG: 50S ribosomal protein L15 [Candidatus Nomurabacteria bacterium GW2011_GWC2_42_20]|uniref:Large ribosomal subunit protein uL15 n=1 Tax=Candidatus Nomurabacteria bacterium GW2011_GWC2_42_20 TaxID=1618756 RepID=A0A0G0ZHF0_9BACT|nr:MAG: 50S ribosomal protein L15 [Candidatus Nomurabacteria bacterium GW2011_GWC2_42_20]KKT07971.1 MAG: 50S ribosomal protein L15 [Candidatus Nomurabacteria bacterium GW2011_GWB1_43_20]TAN37151.1 MAG: 50S ribosomal protein L15 [Patescibacteria group bacterium]